MSDIKTEVPGIYKASEGVLINKDDDALKAYKQRKLKERKIDEMSIELDQIKKDMTEIKELLRGLVK